LNLLHFLETLPITYLDDNPEVAALARKYVEYGVLTEKHWDGLRHIAYAVCDQCDYIVSWNMKHLSNPKTISRVNAVNALIGKPHIAIKPPSFFTGDQP
jgi:hypothetical protein